MHFDRLRIVFTAALAIGISASNIAAAQVACLPIENVIVKDAKSIPLAEIDAITGPFEGRCLGIKEFNDILELVTDKYIGAGLITSRAFLPEQDLSHGVLEIAAVEGTIEAIRFNGEEERLWQNVVYPDLIGRVANIREIEQGLDIVRSMETYRAEMELDPGLDVGTSTLNIQAVTDRPWRLNYSANNFPEDPLGEWNATIGVTYDHLFGINDQWELSYTKSLSPTPFSFGYDGFGSEAVNANVILPYGKWETTLSFSSSRYYQEIDGVFTALPVDGWSKSWVADFKRLMHRDQVSKTFLTFSLSRTENENYILDTLIESSSRVLTSAKLDLSHERPAYGGILKANAYVEKGLTLFGAEDFRKMPEGQPNAQYLRFGLAGSYEKDWRLRAGELSLLSTFSGQYSGDRLYGGQQISIGGPSTVRGVMSAVAAGSTGFYARNEIEWAPAVLKANYVGQASLYAGLDYGLITGQVEYDIPFWQATGGVVGLRLEKGFLDIDVSYGRLINLPDQSRLDEYQDSGKWMISITREF